MGYVENDYEDEDRGKPIHLTTGEGDRGEPVDPDEVEEE